MPTPEYSPSAPVMVTGATGYVAGWLIRRLLEEGFTVHGTVRDPDNQAKVGFLTRMAEELPGEIKLFKADLLDPDAFAAPMTGCEVVFHTASPFVLAVADPQRDLVDPAVNGTTNVLNAANETESVSRVVVTSSCAAIYGDNADVVNAPGGVLTEDVWNTTSSLTHQAYSYSKTEAERAAWKIAEAQDRWRLTTVNPALVIGPGVADSHTSESFSLVKQIGDGTMKSGALPFEIGAVDVRDVAEAHMRAGFMADAEGRYITSARTISIMEIANALREKFADRPLPKSVAPKWLLWLIGPMVDKTVTRKFISGNMGHAWKADNSKIRTKLGMEFRPLDVAAQEMFQQMIDTGALSK
ncbi:MAG: NAD-dependent epimerase/dehydratase family protein [Pseudomonadota bacterium]